MEPNSFPEKSSRNIVTPSDEEVLAKICVRRGYHYGLLRNLIQQGRVVVAILNSTVVQFRFLANGQTVQVCELDRHSNLKSIETNQEPWLWEGTRLGGAHLMIATPIDLLEISAIESGLIGQLDSAVAGIASNEIATLVSQGLIQNSVLAAQSCPGEMWEIGTVGSLNRVAVALLKSLVSATAP